MPPDATSRRTVCSLNGNVQRSKGAKVLSLKFARMLGRIRSVIPSAANRPDWTTGPCRTRNQCNLSNNYPTLDPGSWIAFSTAISASNKRRCCKESARAITDDASPGTSGSRQDLARHESKLGTDRQSISLNSANIKYKRTRL